MICKVKYFNERAAAYAGREYTYRSELPLQIYDKVLVPVKDSEDKRAIVTAIDLPESAIDPAWADAVKNIERYDR